MKGKYALTVVSRECSQTGNSKRNVSKHPEPANAKYCFSNYSYCYLITRKINHFMSLILFLN